MLFYGCRGGGHVENIGRRGGDCLSARVITCKSFCEVLARICLSTIFILMLRWINCAHLNNTAEDQSHQSTKNPKKVTDGSYCTTSHILLSALYSICHVLYKVLFFAVWPACALYDHHPSLYIPFGYRPAFVSI